MHSFAFEQISAAHEAVTAAGHDSQGGASYLAGGTTLLDLMKLDVMQPNRVIDINPLDRTDAGRIELSENGLRLGALARMSDTADHAGIQKQYPAIAQALKLAASQQIRNMASLGGNVLQRTRCTYFRDVSYSACNKRNPGSGCAAVTGFNRSHAVLGASNACIATYPGDFAQVLIALEATVEVVGSDGSRILPFAMLHRKPSDTPDKETNLRPDELIVGFAIPATPWAQRSLYLKVRDRESYEFALASAAVALQLEKGAIRTARIALGGVATVPWRSMEAEAILTGKTLDDSTAQAAADAAFARAVGHGHNDFKIELGKRTLIRALKETVALEIDMANAAAPTPKENMGAPAPRYDARLKVTGEAQFPADTPVGNPAYAALVTSPIAKGRITQLDLDEARAVPGVLTILTYENTSELKPAKFGASSSTSIQDLGPEIQHAGQIIAIVVGDTLEGAHEGAAAVKATFIEQKPSAGFGSEGLREADATKESDQHKELPQAGDATAAISAAEVLLDAEYGTPTQHHNPIELFSTTCVWNGDQLTIYEPSQFVYGLKNGVATRLGISPENVRVVSRFIGGAFGSKGVMTPRTAMIALAAKRLNRPVKLVATRAQGFTVSTYRAETRHHIRLGASRDGKLVGYAHQGWEVSSRPDPYAVAGVEDSAQLYAFGAVSTKVNIVHADRSTPGFMRSPPVVPYIYALESAMDEMAIKLNIDPVEFRRINDTQTSPIGNKPYSSRSLMQCYDQASSAFGWSKRNPQPASMRDGDWLIGWGCATAMYPTHIGPAASRVRLTPKGEAHVQIAAHEIGNGVYTVLAQMAAERLGLDLESVTVEVGDSQLPPAPVAGGSNTTASACNAVMKTCDAIRAKLFHAAVTANDGPLTGRNLNELSLKDGKISTPDGASEDLGDTFKRLGLSTIEEYSEFVPKGLKPDAVSDLYAGKLTMTGGPKGDKVMYATGAEFVEVRVHALTREVRVPRIVGAFAAGRLMNTRTVHSQLMGGMIWGIGSALHEATEIDVQRARYVNDNFADYSVPVNADIQDVEVILVSENDTDVNPAGIKGLGELANVGTAAAIANAVFHATGIRVRQLPIRIESLLTA